MRFPHQDRGAEQADLVPYNVARTALAEAKTVDDVKTILDKAAAMAEYRRRARDRTLELDAIEIRMFAERRLGQMLVAQKQTVGLNKGGRPTEKTGPADGPVSMPTLAEVKITKNLSSKAQKMAALAPEAFEAKIRTWREEAEKEDRVTTNLLHVGREEEQRESRRSLAAALCDTSHELTGERTFPCFYADPAYARKAGIGDRAYENHYPTEKWDGILEIMKKLGPRLQPDAWGFIWIPRAHMLALHPVTYKVRIDDGSIHEVTIRIPLIWALARAAGMDDYSTCFVWTKTDEDHPDEHGTFLIARDQDEILCLYKKGNGLPRPPAQHIYGSNHRERSRPLGHSVKPPFYRKMIADMVGTDSAGRPLPVLELFARFDADHPLPENWEGWGNESGSNGGTDANTGSLSGHRGKSGDDLAARREHDIEGNDRGVDTGRSGEHASTDVADMDGGAPSEGGRVAGDARDRLEIPQEASGTARKAPGGPSLDGPSVVAAYSQVPSGGSDAAGEAEHSSRLHSFSPDPDHHRWEGEGGLIPVGDDDVIVRPARAGRGMEQGR